MKKTLKFLKQLKKTVNQNWNVKKYQQIFKIHIFFNNQKGVNAIIFFQSNINIHLEDINQFPLVHVFALF